MEQERSQAPPIATAEPNPNSPHPRAADRHNVVCPLHGIRTRAEWQRAFAQVAQENRWWCRLDRWSYGRFSIFAFLTPWTREKMLEWFRNAYDEEVNDRNLNLAQGQLPSVVAHSFGTYILGYALLRYDFIRFDKVILCGSILPVDFPWDRIIERGQVQAVRNEYGVRDPWVKRVKCFVRGTGPAGRVGFTRKHERLFQEPFDYDHGSYFGKDHMRDRWIPFLNQQLPPITRNNGVLIPRPPSSIPACLYGAFLALLLLVASALFLLISAQRELQLKPIHNSIGMTMVPIRAGSFTMGAPPGGNSVYENFQRPAHSVHITRPFLLSAYEVTQQQYQAVIGDNPSNTKANNTDLHPVESISWYDAIRFCNRLSDLEGLPPYYELGPDISLPSGVDVPRVVKILGGPGYRLPTEAEWEYACRAGETTIYPRGDNPAALHEYAWYGESDGGTHRVGLKKPNAWELYDMLGNVAEWCWDTLDPTYYKRSPPNDPVIPSGPVDYHYSIDHLAIERGGSYFYDADLVTFAGRGSNLRTATLPVYGFRPARFLAK